MERTGSCCECGASIAVANGRRGPIPKRCSGCKTRRQTRQRVSPVELARIRSEATKAYWETLSYEERQARMAAALAGSARRWQSYQRPTKPPAKERYCAECGVVLTGRYRVICSKKCRNQRLIKSEAFKKSQKRYRISDKGRATARAHNRRSREKGLGKKPCARCGRAFNWHPELRVTFCSKKCRSEYRCLDGRSSLVLSGRKTAIPPEHESQVLRRLSRPAPSMSVCIGTCEVCAEVFVVPGQHRATCSVECAEGKLRADRQMAKDRRRALKKAAFVENVRRNDIFERDGWKCQLCGDPLNRAVVAPHPDAPTIDHIIPLAQGGTHEPRNVQAAHFLCNSRKGDRGAACDQLRLVG